MEEEYVQVCRVYPRFEDWLRDLDEGTEWFQGTAPHDLGGQIRRHWNVLERFGLIDVPVTVTFSAEHFGWVPGRVAKYTWVVTPSASEGSMHPLAQAMAVEYCDGSAEAAWEPSVGPNKSAVFTYQI
jgi:hypothetical protein